MRPSFCHAIPQHVYRWCMRHKIKQFQPISEVNFRNLVSDNDGSKGLRTSRWPRVRPRDAFRHGSVRSESLAGRVLDLARYDRSNFSV